MEEDVSSELAFITAETSGYYDAYADEVKRRTDLRDYSRAAGGFVNSVPRGSTVFDVGCGTGQHLRLLSDRGLCPIGIDPSSRMRQIAGNLGFKVLDGTFNSLDRVLDISGSGAWCASSLLHVPIGHAHDALTKLVQVLRDEASVFITVRRGLFAGWDKWDGPKGLAKRYIQEYMEDDLVRLMLQANIEPFELWLEQSSWGRASSWISVLGHVRRNK